MEQGYEANANCFAVVGTALMSRGGSWDLPVVYRMHFVGDNIKRKLWGTRQ